MARSKKGSTTTSKASRASVLAQTDGGVRDAGHLATERLRRKHDENVSFWESLGYRDAIYKRHHLNSAIDDKLSATKKPKSWGRSREKYDLFVNPSTKRVLLLQYPNRDPREVYCDATGHKPIEIRIKPRSGIVEVDIPMTTRENFDREKGVDFGVALKKSQTLQRGGSYGLPGGLGIGPNKSARNDEILVPDGPLRDTLLENFEDSNNKGLVMNRITLGGRIVPFKDGDPMYMIATFVGTRCTWTRLDAMVQLRPHFGHLDAINEQEKSSARSDRTAESRIREERAEDVNMVIKDTADNENVDMYGGMNETAKLLRAIRDEPWQRLRWIDQEDHDSYQIYKDVLLYNRSDDGPHLVTEMTNEQYLDAISCPRIDPISQGKKVMRSPDDDEYSSDEDETASIEAATEPDAVDVKGDDSDISDGGRAYETLPKGVIQPDGIVERDIERICRIICMEAKPRRERFEHLLSEAKGQQPRFSFLIPGNNHHSYFRWRLHTNEMGNGIGPEFDHGTGVREGEAVK